MDEIYNYQFLNKMSYTYGDSFYVFDGDRFEDNYDRLSVAFKKYYPNFRIAYSYKTNYTPQIVMIVNKRGGYAEVVSAFETKIAKNAGVNYSDIIWNGPTKKRKDLIEFIHNGGLVNIDNLIEAKMIRDYAVDNPEIKCNIGFRCNFPVGDGVLSRFGLDIFNGDIDEAIRLFLDVENVNIVSIHCHFAKRELEYWKNRVNGMLELYNRIIEEYDVHPKIIDLGGGMYGNMPTELSEQITDNPSSYWDYADVVGKAFADRFDRKRGPQLVIEPGSALIADCFNYVMKVYAIKKVAGRYIANVTGSQKNISMQGVTPPLRIVNRDNDGTYYDSIDIAGYTCIESDYLCHNYRGILSVGDYIIISNCGSYSVTMKPPFIEPNVPILAKWGG